MPIAAKNIMYAWAIALGLMAVSVSPANAQTNTPDSFEFDKIELGEDRNWNFQSENETTSVRDNLQELKQYSISDSEDTDVRLEQEERRWGNQGNIEDYSIKTNVYDY